LKIFILIQEHWTVGLGSASSAAKMTQPIVGTRKSKKFENMIDDGLICRIRVAYFKNHQFGIERRARQAVANALRSGRLVKQLCEVCKVVETESHHDDYTKPLEVRWLCKSHHVEADRIRRKKESGGL
jgi:hypothetical protein